MAEDTTNTEQAAPAKTRKAPQMVITDAPAVEAAPAPKLSARTLAEQKRGAESLARH